MSKTFFSASLLQLQLSHWYWFSPSNLSGVKLSFKREGTVSGDVGVGAAMGLDVEGSGDGLLLGIAKCRSVNQPEVQEVVEQVRQV